jgi:hypothetical protein
LTNLNQQIPWEPAFSLIIIMHLTSGYCFPILSSSEWLC